MELTAAKKVELSSKWHQYPPQSQHSELIHCLYIITSKQSNSRLFTNQRLLWVNVDQATLNYSNFNKYMPFTNQQTIPKAKVTINIKSLKHQKIPINPKQVEASIKLIQTDKKNTEIYFKFKNQRICDRFVSIMNAINQHQYQKYPATLLTHKIKSFLYGNANLAAINQLQQSSSFAFAENSQFIPTTNSKHKKEDIQVQNPQKNITDRNADQEKKPFQDKKSLSVVGFQQQKVQKQLDKASSKNSIIDNIDNISNYNQSRKMGIDEHVESFDLYQEDVKNQQNTKPPVFEFENLSQRLQIGQGKVQNTKYSNKIRVNSPKFSKQYIQHQFGATQREGSIQYMSSNVKGQYPIYQNKTFKSQTKKYLQQPQNQIYKQDKLQSKPHSKYFQQKISQSSEGLKRSDKEQMIKNQFQSNHFQEDFNYEPKKYLPTQNISLKNHKFIVQHQNQTNWVIDFVKAVNTKNNKFMVIQIYQQFLNQCEAIIENYLPLILIHSNKDKVYYQNQINFSVLSFNQTPGPSISFKQFPQSAKDHATLYTSLHNAEQLHKQLIKDQLFLLQKYLENTNKYVKMVPILSCYVEFNTYGIQCQANLNQRQFVRITNWNTHQQVNELIQQFQDTIEISLEGHNFEIYKSLKIDSYPLYVIKLIQPLTPHVSSSQNILSHLTHKFYLKNGFNQDCNSMLKQKLQNLLIPQLSVTLCKTDILHSVIGSNSYTNLLTHYGINHSNINILYQQPNLVPYFQKYIASQLCADVFTKLAQHELHREIAKQLMETEISSVEDVKTSKKQIKAFTQQFLYFWTNTLLSHNPPFSQVLWYIIWSILLQKYFYNVSNLGEQLMKVSDAQSKQSITIKMKTSHTIPGALLDFILNKTNTKIKMTVPIQKVYKQFPVEFTYAYLKKDTLSFLRSSSRKQNYQSNKDFENEEGFVLHRKVLHARMGSMNDSIAQLEFSILTELCKDGLIKPWDVESIIGKNSQTNGSISAQALIDIAIPGQFPKHMEYLKQYVKLYVSLKIIQSEKTHKYDHLKLYDTNQLTILSHFIKQRPETAFGSNKLNTLQFIPHSHILMVRYQVIINKFINKYQYNKALYIANSLLEQNVFWGGQFCMAMVPIYFCLSLYFYKICESQNQSGIKNSSNFNNFVKYFKSALVICVKVYTRLNSKIGSIHRQFAQLLINLQQYQEAIVELQCAIDCYQQNGNLTQLLNAIIIQSQLKLKLLKSNTTEFHGSFGKQNKNSGFGSRRTGASLQNLALYRSEQVNSISQPLIQILVTSMKSTAKQPQNIRSIVSIMQLVFRIYLITYRFKELQNFIQNIICCYPIDGLFDKSRKLNFHVPQNQTQLTKMLKLMITYIFKYSQLLSLEDYSDAHQKQSYSVLYSFIEKCMQQKQKQDVIDIINEWHQQQMLCKKNAKNARLSLGGLYDKINSSIISICAEKKSLQLKFASMKHQNQRLIGQIINIVGTQFMLGLLESSISL